MLPSLHTPSMFRSMLGIFLYLPSLLYLRQSLTVPHLNPPTSLPSPVVFELPRVPMFVFYSNNVSICLTLRPLYLRSRAWLIVLGDSRCILLHRIRHNSNNISSTHHIERDLPPLSFGFLTRSDTPQPATGRIIMAVMTMRIVVCRDRGVITFLSSGGGANCSCHCKVSIRNHVLWERSGS